MTSWIDEYCLSLRGASIEYQIEWEATKYCLCEKMFAMRGCDKNGINIITVKLKPETSERLRYLYKDFVVEGYYMNKTHWSSFYYEKGLSKKLICESLEEGYNLILNGFSKKKQLEILE